MQGLFQTRIRIDLMIQIVFFDPGVKLPVLYISSEHPQRHLVVLVDLLRAKWTLQLNIVVSGNAAQRAHKVLKLVEVIVEGIDHDPFTEIVLQSIHVPQDCAHIAAVEILRPNIPGLSLLVTDTKLGAAGY